MPDNTACGSFSPKAAPAFGADCKRCGRAYAEHAPITVTERRTYRVGELLTLRSGAQWRVANVYPHDDGNPGVGLVNPLNPNHGTAFYADVLDTLVVTEPFTEEGDYPAGTDFVVSAHVDPDDSPTVSVSSAHVARTFLHLTTASAREVAAALLIAADHADRDAKVTVHADADGVFTIPKAGAWEFSTNLDAAKQRIAALYAGNPALLPALVDKLGRGQANRETVGAEESGESKAELHRRAWAPGNHPAAAPDAPDYLA